MKSKDIPELAYIRTGAWLFEHASDKNAAVSDLAGVRRYATVVLVGCVGGPAGNPSSSVDGSGPRTGGHVERRCRAPQEVASGSRVGDLIVRAIRRRMR
jgi:hypothetical protein